MLTSNNKLHSTPFQCDTFYCNLQFWTLHSSPKPPFGISEMHLIIKMTIKTKCVSSQMIMLSLLNRNAAEYKSLNVKILFKPESLKQDNITETVIIKFHLLFFYHDKPLKSHFHECLMMIIIWVYLNLIIKVLSSKPSLSTVFTLNHWLEHANVFDVKRQIYYVLDCRFQCLAPNVGI